VTSSRQGVVPDISIERSAFFKAKQSKKCRLTVLSTANVMLRPPVRKGRGIVSHLSKTAPCLQRIPRSAHYLATDTTAISGRVSNCGSWRRPSPRLQLHLIRYTFCLYSSLLIRKCCCILPGHRSASACRAVSPVCRHRCLPAGIRM
jgi:hypothetical protein